MSKATILFADNDFDFLQTRGEFLIQEGYNVILANNPVDARRILESNRIDLAILDIRLVNDDDDKDTSGLVLAKEVARSVPKIILTGFPSYEYARQALVQQFDDLPPAKRFVTKYEGPEAMLQSIQSIMENTHLSLIRRLYNDLLLTLETKTHPNRHVPSSTPEMRLAPVTFDITSQLKRDYDEVGRQVVLDHRIRLVLTVVGVLVIIAGGVGVLTGQVAIGLLTATSGVIAELLGVLLVKSGEDANKRMDQYHKELVLFYKQSLRGKDEPK